MFSSSVARPSPRKGLPESPKRAKKVRKVEGLPESVTAENNGIIWHIDTLIPRVSAACH